MKIINEVFKHKEKGFVIIVLTCNSRRVVTQDLKTKEKIVFNRVKFEWMINKGIFTLQQ